MPPPSSPRWRAAAAVDPFSVAGVAVDATAATAAAARDTALADGQRKAFRQLLERLASPADYGRLPRPSDAEITALVAGFQVQEERASAVRYLATLTYSFRPNAVRALLRGAGIAVAETASRPVLLVPLLKTTATGAALWEPTNSWRQVWLDKPPPTGLVPVVVPTGTPDDMAALSTAQAQGGDPAALAALLQRYDAGEALIGEAALDAAGVMVTLRRPGSPDPVFSDRLVQTATEGQADLLRRAAARVVQGLEERWKREDRGGAAGRCRRPDRARAAAEPERLARDPAAPGGHRVRARRLGQEPEPARGHRRAQLLRRCQPAELVLAQRQLELEQLPEGWLLRVLGAGGQTGARAPAAPVTLAPP
ncbi:MAG: DUF2066 domain-containing protein [Pseudomonadota bacterium]